MEALKNYLIDMILKTGGPSAVRGGVLSVIAWMIMHNNLLMQYGVTTSGSITTIDWSKATGALIALVPVIAGMIKLGQVHGTQIVDALKNPQGESK